MLLGASIEKYARIQREIGNWLQSNSVAHCIPAALPSEYYADASHPLGPGYALLAEQLVANSAFARMCR